MTSKGLSLVFTILVFGAVHGKNGLDITCRCPGRMKGRGPRITDGTATMQDICGDKFKIFNHNNDTDTNAGDYTVDFYVSDSPLKLINETKLNKSPLDSLPTKSGNRSDLSPEALQAEVEALAGLNAMTCGTRFLIAIIKKTTDAAVTYNDTCGFVTIDCGVGDLNVTVDSVPPRVPVLKGNGSSLKQQLADQGLTVPSVVIRNTQKIRATSELNARQLVVALVHKDERRFDGGEGSGMGSGQQGGSGGGEGKGGEGKEDLEKKRDQYELRNGTMVKRMCKFPRMSDMSILHVFYHTEAIGPNEDWVIDANMLDSVKVNCGCRECRSAKLVFAVNPRREIADNDYCNNFVMMDVNLTCNADRQSGGDRGMPNGGEQPTHTRGKRAANLQGANLQGANSLGANLQGANSLGANLQGGNWQGGNSQGANWQGMGSEKMENKGPMGDDAELRIIPNPLDNGHSAWVEVSTMSMRKMMMVTYDMQHESFTWSPLEHGSSDYEGMMFTMMAGHNVKRYMQLGEDERKGIEYFVDKMERRSYAAALGFDITAKPMENPPETHKALRQEIEVLKTLSGDDLLNLARGLLDQLRQLDPKTNEEDRMFVQDLALALYDTLGEGHVFDGLNVIISNITDMLDDADGMCLGDAFLTEDIKNDLLSETAKHACPNLEGFFKNRWRDWQKDCHRRYNETLSQTDRYKSKMKEPTKRLKNACAHDENHVAKHSISKPEFNLKSMLSLYLSGRGLESSSCGMEKKESLSSRFSTLLIQHADAYMYTKDFVASKINERKNQSCNSTIEDYPELMPVQNFRIYWTADGSKIYGCINMGLNCPVEHDSTCCKVMAVTDCEYCGENDVMQSGGGMNDRVPDNNQGGQMQGDPRSPPPMGGITTPRSIGGLGGLGGLG